MRRQLYLSFRDLDVERGGAVLDGGWYALPVPDDDPEWGWGGGLAPRGRVAYRFTPLDPAAVHDEVAGRTVRFVVHGFNVSRNSGFRSTGLLGAHLEALDPEVIDVGVLWPGDFLLPVLNYPFEFGDARLTAVHFARRLRTLEGQAAALRFVTHSFGIRVVLEALRHAAEHDEGPLPVQELFITAGADDCDVLDRDTYRAALRGVERVVNVASVHDRVLWGAFPFGDAVEAALWRDQRTFRAAIGRRGPRRHGFGDRLVAYRSGRWAHDHGDYLPDFEDSVRDAPDGETRRAIARRAAVAELIGTAPEDRTDPNTWASGP